VKQPFSSSASQPASSSASLNPRSCLPTPTTVLYNCAVQLCFVPPSDHKLNHYYYRVANSPHWKRIALNEVNWRSMTCIKYMKVSVVPNCGQT
jgi:hypothetical protein